MRLPFSLSVAVTSALAVALAAITVAKPTHAETFPQPNPQTSIRGWMAEDSIRTELVGVQLSGIYPNKVAWTELIHPDGTSDYREGPDIRPGRWSVSGELFCFIYAQPQQGGCFRIVKHSPNCYELYTATIGGEAPVIAPPSANMSWNGRMWREADTPTCQDKPIS